MFAGRLHAGSPIVVGCPGHCVSVLLRASAAGLPETTEIQSLSLAAGHRDRTKSALPAPSPAPTPRSGGPSRAPPRFHMKLAQDLIKNLLLRGL